MEDLENWLREILRSRERNDMDWFLNRPSLRHAREREMEELA